MTGDTRISALPEASALTGTEVVPLVQNGATKRTTLSQWSTYALTLAPFADVTQKLTDEDVSVFDYLSDAQKADVQAGTLTLDTSSGFVAALATGKRVLVPNGPGWEYLMGATVTVPSNSTLYGEWPKIKLANGVNNHVFRIANSASRVVIRGLEIDGNRANNTGGHVITTGGPGADNIKILENRIHGGSGHGVYFDGTSVTNIFAIDNEVWDCYSGGITLGALVLKFSVALNHCYQNGTHGAGIFGIGKHGSFVGNVCWDNGQGTPNADNLTGYNASNDDIVVSSNVSWGGGNNGIHFGGTRITYTGNQIYGATQYGLAHIANTGTANTFSMTGNVSYDNGKSGFYIENAKSGTVTGNTSEDNTEHGIVTDNCENIAITGNTAKGNTLSGINNGTASSYLAITGNTSRSNGDDGIRLQNITFSTVVGNTIGGNTGYGIGVAGTEGNNVIVGNNLRVNTAGQIQQPATTTRVSNNETGVSRTIASAATLTLPPGGEYFYITGTTGITSIPASFPERRVTLQFDDVLTVTDGSNLRMAGNFTTSFMDTLSLICDGTNWTETSRSVN